MNNHQSYEGGLNHIWIYWMFCNLRQEAIKPRGDKRLGGPHWLLLI